MSKKTLSDMLNSIKKKREPKNGPDNIDSKEGGPKIGEIQRVKDIKSTMSIAKDDNQNLGLIDKLRANNLKSQKQLEAQKVIFNTQIERLRHQAEATERQSKAYWDAQSVDITEGLKTYSQQNMQLLEKERLENKSEAVNNAYLIANQKMEEIFQMTIPDSVKEEMVVNIIEIRDEALNRIKQDTIAKKYGLGPDE